MPLTFTWTQITGFPDDAAVALVHIAPVVGGPGAILTFKQHDQIRLAWLYGTTIKLLDDDLFEQDAYKDADGMAWLAMDNKLYAVVSHAYGDAGATARLAIGVADAPWAASAYSLLDNRTDARAQAVVQTALQGGGSGEADHAAEERRAEIERLTTEIESLHSRIDGLEPLVMGTAEKMTTAGRALVG